MKRGLNGCFEKSLLLFNLVMREIAEVVWCFCTADFDLEMVQRYRVVAQHKIEAPPQVVIDGVMPLGYGIPVGGI